MASIRTMAKGVQSVERSLALLEALRLDEGPLGITELAERTGLAYATTHRLLATLEKSGLVRHASRRYVLGPGLVALGKAASRRFNSWAHPYLVRLTETSGETANLAALEDDHVIYLAQAASSHMVRMFMEVGKTAPIHATGVGKVLLAYRSRKVVEAWLSGRALAALTPNTIVSAEQLLEELDAIARVGYAVDHEEAELGVRCIAVPVWGVAEGDEPIAALSVSGPSGRLTHSHCEEVLPEMIRIAAEMADG